MRRRCFTGHRRDRGGVVVELAIVFPLLLLVVFGSIQVATYFSARSLAQNAAQAAVTAERQYGAQVGGGRVHAAEFLEQGGDWLTAPQVSDPTYTATGLSYTISGNALSLLPGVAWHVEQTAHGTREQVTESTTP